MGPSGYGAWAMKFLIVAALALGMVTPAAAEKWDLSAMTCQQFTGADKTTIMIILTWLDAYYKDEDAPPVIDTDKFAENADKLADYCGKNPTLGLITAADTVFN